MKSFTGAPFGTQKSRFDVSAVHPKSKRPGTYTQVSYCKKAMDESTRKLGPGKYNIQVEGFSENAVIDRASGPGWARAFDVARMAALPNLLYREEWEKKRLQKRNLGPGTYNIKDFLEDESNRKRSTRGACGTREKRFKQAYKEVTPGPGTYGEGGVPQAAIDSRDLKPAGVVGMLDAASTSRSLPAVGCPLGPGTYEVISATDQVVRKMVGKRGPYDITTGERGDNIKRGHHAVPGMPNLGPGTYEAKSFVDKWTTEHRGHHGKFGKVAQYPELPTERLLCTTLSQWPRVQSQPGPGNYNPRELSRPENKSAPPFISSAERFDRRARKFFSGANNPVGTGRYDIQRWDEKQHKNGHTSSFNSKVTRGSTTRDGMMQERIKAKKMPPPEKVLVEQPYNDDDYIRARRVLYTQA